MGNFYEDNQKVSKKDWLTSLVLCWFLGFFGVHRLYTGKIASGFSMMGGTIVSISVLLTESIIVGAFGLIIVGSFVLYDFLNILIKNFKDVNGREVSEDTVVK